MKRLGCMLVAVAGFQALFTGCKCGFEAKRGMECKPDVLAVLPAYCPTPDGMAIDAKGNLIAACPNFVDRRSLLPDKDRQEDSEGRAVGDGAAA